MTPLPPRELLRAVYDHLDLDALLANHPELTRQDVDDLFLRLVELLGAPPPPVEKPLPPGALPPAPVPPPGTDADMIVHSDGSSRGNPGPAGIGVVILHRDGTILREISRPIGRATSNVAEYRAALAGLAEARALGAKRLLLRTDSELLVRQVRGEYRVRHAGLKPLHAELARATARLDHFACEHVSRQANARADALATAATRKRRGPPPSQ